MGTETHNQRGPRLAEAQDYAVLRQSGTPPDRARRLLRLEGVAAGQLEAGFRAALKRPSEHEKPRFVRDEAHVAAVMKEGGFCAFSETRIGKHHMALRLPLIWPTEERHGTR